MVRHTHRRRQTRGRRRQTRRNRRTQRGGFSFSSFFGSSDDIEKMKEELAQETDPIEKAEIQKKITYAEADETFKKAKKSIEEKGSAGAATGGVYSTGAGQMASSGANNSMYSGTGGRRRSRRYRRR
jgi:hypothetical protein